MTKAERNNAIVTLYRGGYTQEAVSQQPQSCSTQEKADPWLCDLLSPASAGSFSQNACDGVG